MDNLLDALSRDLNISPDSYTALRITLQAMQKEIDDLKNRIRKLEKIHQNQLLSH